MRLKISFISFSLIWLLPALAGAQVQREGIIEPDDVLATYGQVKTLPAAIPLFPLQPRTATNRVFTTELPFNNILRIHFTVWPGSASSWHIRILDNNNVTLDANLTKPQNGNDFWSSEIRVSNPTIEVYCADNPCGLQLVVDAIAIPSIQAKPQGITLPKNQLKEFKNTNPPLSDWINIQKWGKPVAKLRIMGDNKKLYSCTGFLLTPDLLMTNHHCIKSDTERQAARADFDYDRDNAPKTNLSFSELICINEELDFTLLRLAHKMTDREPLKFDAAMMPTKNEKLLMIEHPLGTPKKLSIEDCDVGDAQIINQGFTRVTDFAHRCDTLNGSSGSPILERTSGSVVGLHHFNFEPTDKKFLNQGVIFSLIVNELRNALKDTRPEVLKELGIK